MPNIDTMPLPIPTPSALLGRPLIIAVKALHPSAQKHRGVSHRDNTVRAFERLETLLVHYRNRLSDDHRTALMALVGSMSEMAQGKLQGRYAFGIPTGMGKTTAIVAWIACLHESGALGQPTSVAVSAMKVEALCSLKQALIAQGVPEGQIALVHSKGYREDCAPAVRDGTAEQKVLDAFASEPSDGGKDRPIVLVTHERVRSCDMDTFMCHHGRPRDLLIYDESLMRSDATGIDMRDLRAAVRYLEDRYGDQDAHKAAIAFAKNAYAVLEAKLQTGGGTLTLPAITDTHPTTTPEKIAGAVQWVRSGRKGMVTEHAAQLLELSGCPVRVLNVGQGGLVSYVVSVPEEIDNILVLDASYPIRRLVKLDPTIRDAETHVDACRNLDTPMSRIKRFDRVTIRQAFAGGGRETMEDNFRKEDKSVLREVVGVVRDQISSNEDVLIFTYKHRHRSGGIDFRKAIMEGLERAGVNLDRIHVATWGQETNLNRWSHCGNVVLAGVLQLPPMAVGATGIGQSDNLDRDVGGDDLRDWHRSEVCHAIYQALSRGSCRVAEDGYALPMNAWIIHRDDAIRAELERVMPGAKWKRWEPTYVREGVTAALAQEIAEHLETLLEDTVDRISTQKLKQAMSKTDKDGVPARTWTNAVRRFLDTQEFPLWKQEGRSLVRSSSVFKE